MPSKYKKKEGGKFARRPIYQYTLNEEFVREWNSIGEAARTLNMERASILRCCNGEQERSYWFIWRYKDDVLKEQEEKQQNDQSE